MLSSINTLLGILFAGAPRIRDYLRNAISLPDKIEEVTKSATEVSMQAAADELHEEAGHISVVTGCIDIPVSFDS